MNKKVPFYSVPCNCPNVHIIFLVQFGIFGVLLYRPPGSGVHENDVLINFLVDFCVGKEAVVMGDFNLPDIKWPQSDCMSFNYQPDVQQFINAFLSAGLTQWVVLPTFPRSGNILDLDLSTEDDRIGSVLFLAP